MMDLQNLLLLKLILLFHATSTLSYPNPIYGTKRYDRSSQHRVNTYDPYSHYQTPRYPVDYYKMNPYSQNPYSQNYPDNYYYYPQESYQYPMYYAPARTSKYEIYQAVLPYYYQETPVPRQGYNSYYDYSDPVVDVPQDEVLQQAQMQEREDNQPIGHESYYENDMDATQNDNNLEDINAAFLQNLILSQMYQDTVDRTSKDGYVDYDEEFAKINTDVENNKNKPNHMSEDETVRELKQLSEAGMVNQYRNKDVENNEVHWTQANQKGNKGQRKNRQRQRKQQKQETKRASDIQNDILPFPENDLLYYDRKPIVKSTNSPLPIVASTGQPKREIRGQKEEFQMRPATPVRHPFASPVLQIMSGENERKRTPNVYDTIKHLLEMEKGFEKNQGETDIRPVMKKRIITPEDSLTRQLSVLKKAQ